MTYRRYEDPGKLQNQLDELLARKSELMAEGKYDDDMIEYFAQEEAELTERINFAWQDEEFDAQYAADNYEEVME